jgi:hypothetical protein
MFKPRGGLVLQASEIFPDRSDASIQLARKWLLLGVFALVAAGLFSVLLVLSRTPAIQEVIPFIDFFHVALVVHVNLSVLIWFMSFACVLWTLTSEDSLMPLAKLSFYLALAGTLVLVVAPFFGVGDPLMNNYIPTLQHPVFFASLLLFAAGVLLRLFVSLLATRIKFSNLSDVDAARVSIWLGVPVCAISLWALYKSYSNLPAELTGELYYEFLYWGSGHVLQFNHSLLMLMAWFILILFSGGSVLLSGRWILFLSLLVVLPVLDTFRIYASFPVYSAEHRLAFTQLMTWGGLSTLPLGLFITYLFITSFTKELKEQSLIRTVLLCSGTLFLTGGVIGFLIEGVNVVIPAHYHGSIVGVTLAFMGLSYLLLPFLGFAPARVKLAKAQMYTYSVGQMMHIIGLAWSGGYGVQRKTAGAAQDLDSIERVIGMGMMGMGGAISIVGGVLFMLVMIFAIRDQKEVKEEDKEVK